jgi:hypothetical protein
MILYHLLHISKYLSGNASAIMILHAIDCDTIFSLERNVLWEAIENQSDVQKLYWNVVVELGNAYVQINSLTLYCHWIFDPPLPLLRQHVFPAAVTL